jgi:tRNA(Arg) A34 adenosine deaminase TadA
MDNVHLKRSLQLAKQSFDQGGVPVGAVLTTIEGQVITEGYNENKQTFDPTAHAEIICMRKAKKLVLSKYSPEPTILYTTLEPCFACAFFVLRTNIKKVVWALNDPYNGAMEFLRNNDKLKDRFLNIEIIAEPFDDLKTSSKELMRSYYENKGDVKLANLFV